MVSDIMTRPGPHDQQNFVLCKVSFWTDRSCTGISWTVTSLEMQEEGEGLELRLGLVWVGVRLSVKAWG